jgi:hypothetical protein
MRGMDVYIIVHWLGPVCIHIIILCSLYTRMRIERLTARSVWFYLEIHISDTERERGGGCSGVVRIVIKKSAEN